MKYEYVKISQNCIPGGNKTMYQDTIGCGSNMRARIWYDDRGNIDEQKTYTPWYLKYKYGR